MQDIDLLNSVADNIQGRTICALGDAAAMPVRAMIKHFRDEFVALIEKARSRCTPADRLGRQRPSRAELAAADAAYGWCRRPTRRPRSSTLVKP